MEKRYQVVVVNWPNKVSDNTIIYGDANNLKEARQIRAKAANDYIGDPRVYENNTYIIHIIDNETGDIAINSRTAMNV